jgi:hypothetical protein
VLIDSFWHESQIKDCFERVEKADTGLLVNHVQYIIDNANTRNVRTNGAFKIGLHKSTIKNYTLLKTSYLNIKRTQKKQIHLVGITKSFAAKFTNRLVNIKNYSTNYSGKRL